MHSTSADQEPHAATFACGHCGAGLAFTGVRSEVCPYCASPNFVERPPRAHQPTPALVVAFTGDAALARARIADWLGSRTWFADARIKRATIEALRGVYVPAYLYSAVAHTEYTASIAEHYTELETYEVDESASAGKRGEGGFGGAVDGALGARKQTRTRTVTRAEYRPLSGHHVDYVTDVIVSASTGLADGELRAVLPYELLAVRRYSPALITGWIAEEFSRDSDDCRRSSRRAAVDDVGDRLRQFMPGDSHSDLTWRTQVQWETLDPILVPVWVLAVRYRDDKPALRVVINGQTGAITGRVPLAWWKIALAVAGLAGLVALILVLTRGGAP